MTVSELITKLQTMPQDAKVLLMPYLNNDRWDREIRDIMYNKPDTKFAPHTVELDNWPAEGYINHETF